MMTLKDKNPALILIDVQNAFKDDPSWGERNNLDAEQICGTLLSLWRHLQLPIFHIRHSSLDTQSSLHPSHLGHAFNDHVTPKSDETVITKQVNSAFIGTNLKALLERQAIDTLVIIGLTTNHCVSTTARMAGNYRFNTYVIADATATFGRNGFEGQPFNPEILHQTALASLHGEFATVITSSQLKHLL